MSYPSSSLHPYFIPVVKSKNSRFQCFFFHHIGLIFLDSCTESLYSCDHELTRSTHSACESVLCTNLYWEEQTWEITESGQFCDTHCYLPYHCRNWCVYSLGTYLHELVQVNRFAPQCSRHWRRVVHSHRNVKMYPSTPSLTRLRSDFDFWIQKVR